MNLFDKLTIWQARRHARRMQRYIDEVVNELSPFQIGDTVITKYGRVCTITRIQLPNWHIPQSSELLYHLLDDESDLVHKPLGLDDLRIYEAATSDF